MKTFIRMATFAAAAVLAGCGAAGDAAGRLITFESLLNEMVDRDATARLPEPPYACRQFSSYDRRSKTPDDPKGWFANADRGHFLRTENSGGRTEWVVMDHIGQGCVTRIWTPTKYAQFSGRRKSRAAWATRVSMIDHLDELTGPS